MQAMVYTQRGQPLSLQELELPKPRAHEVRLRVRACGVCRTDLHIIEGDLPTPALPLILGHQIVGYVDALGEDVTGFTLGQRVGVPWLGRTCGQCNYCLSDAENLCDAAQFTGYHLNGGYAEFCLAHAAYIFPLPDAYSDEQIAPLLCAGMIGYRSLRLIQPARRIGFYGFGASAHLLCQVVAQQGGEVYAFTRPGDTEGQQFACSLGAVWAGGSDQRPPVLLDGAIIFAPLGDLFPVALEAVRKGGRVISAGIHMSPIPTFSYDLLWGERMMGSVANLTRQDGREFLHLATHIPLYPHIQTYPLQDANQALADLKHGRLQGSAVLVI